MTLAVYPGSFDPPTLGHIDVVRASLRLFDHVVILIANNPAKKSLFCPRQRREFWEEICEQMPQVSASTTSGLVVDYAKEIGARVLVRGIRGGNDADAETDLAHINATLAPELSTILLPAIASSRHVSSTLLKEMAQRGEDVSKLCAPVVDAALKRAFASEGGAQSAGNAAELV